MEEENWARKGRNRRREAVGWTPWQWHVPDLIPSDNSFPEL